MKVGKKRVARLMRELEIQGVSRRRGRVGTTMPDKRAAPAPDLVNRNFTATRPDETWVADITYVPTHEGWLLLAAVMDLYSRKIVGWSMRDDLEAPLVVDAISMAITPRAEAGPRPSLRSRLALFRYIESFCNPLRRHSRLEMRSPDEYEHRYWEDNATVAAA